MARGIVVRPPLLLWGEFIMWARISIVSSGMSSTRIVERQYHENIDISCYVARNENVPHLVSIINMPSSSRPSWSRRSRGGALPSYNGEQPIHGIFAGRCRPTAPGLMACQRQLGCNGGGASHDGEHCICRGKIFISVHAAAHHA